MANIDLTFNIDTEDSVRGVHVYFPEAATVNANFTPAPTVGGYFYKVFSQGPDTVDWNDLDYVDYGSLPTINVPAGNVLVLHPSTSSRSVTAFEVVIQGSFDLYPNKTMKNAYGVPSTKPLPVGYKRRKSGLSKKCVKIGEATLHPFGHSISHAMIETDGSTPIRYAYGGFGYSIGSTQSVINEWLMVFKAPAATTGSYTLINDQYTGSAVRLVTDTNSLGLTVQTTFCAIEKNNIPAGSYNSLYMRFEGDIGATEFKDHFYVSLNGVPISTNFATVTIPATVYNIGFFGNMQVGAFPNDEISISKIAFFRHSPKAGLGLSSQQIRRFHNTFDVPITEPNLWFYCDFDTPEGEYLVGEQLPAGLFGYPTQPTTLLGDVPYYEVFGEKNLYKFAPTPVTETYGTSGPTPSYNTYQPPPGYAPRFLINQDF